MLTRSERRSAPGLLWRMEGGPPVRTTTMAPAREAARTSLNIALLLFAVYLVLARLQPDLRYTRYLLPLFLTALWLARRERGVSNRLVSPSLMPYVATVALICVWSAASIAWTSSFYARYFEEALFLSTPLWAAAVCLSFTRDVDDRPICLLAAILLVDYLWAVGLSTILAALASPAVLLDQLLQSRAPTESSRAFSLGIVAIYLISRRRWLLAAIVTVAVVLASKRIVLAGLAVAVPIAVLRWSFAGVNRRAVLVALAVGANVGVALSLRNLQEWGIADAIHYYTSQSADLVLMGRASLFAILTDRLPEAPWLGVGLGRITYILEAEGAWLTNTHSDILKHYMELGPIVFSLWIGCFYWMSRRAGVVALAVLMNVLFLSDNVAIYFDVMFVFYLCFGILDRQPAPELALNRTAVARRPLAWPAQAQQRQPAWAS